MSMEAHRGLIERLEIQSAANPALYKFKIFLLSTLGFLFIFVMLALALGFGVGVFLFAILTKNAFIIKLLAKLFWIPLVLAFYIFKAFFIKIEPPQGMLLSKKEFPQLFERLAHTRKILGAQKIHKVILNDELNAAVVTVPRLGFLGWKENYLVIGMPLLMLLSPAEFDSVLAHEFGHISNKHTRFGNWIYRVRMTWYQLLASVEQKHTFVSGIFVQFFNWYAPFFDAYTFVLARQNEYQADADAAKVTDTKIAASALTRVYSMSGFADQEFWQQVWEGAKTSDSPPQKIYNQLCDALNEFSPDKIEPLTKTALSGVTGLQDTHPCLADRLRALGGNGELHVNQESAAKVYLHNSYKRLIGHFSTQWQYAVNGRWKELYEYFQAARKSQELLADKISANEATVAEIVEYAEAIESLQSPQDAMAYFEMALAKDAGNVAANYRVGHILLNQNDDAGETYLLKVGQLASESKAEIAETLYHYFSYRENSEKVSEYEKLINECYQDRAKMEQTLGELNRKDELIEVDFDDKLKYQIINRLEPIKKISKIWWALKKNPKYPEHDTLVIVVKLKGMLLDEQQKVNEILEAVQAPYFTQILTTGMHSWLNKKIKKLPNSLAVSHSMFE